VGVVGRGWARGELARGKVVDVMGGGEEKQRGDDDKERINMRAIVDGVGERERIVAGVQ